MLYFSFVLLIFCYSTQDRSYPSLFPRTVGVVAANDFLTKNTKNLHIFVPSSRLFSPFPLYSFHEQRKLGTGIPTKRYIVQFHGSNETARTDDDETLSVQLQTNRTQVVDDLLTALYRTNDTDASSFFIKSYTLDYHNQLNVGLFELSDTVFSLLTKKNRLTASLIPPYNDSDSVIVRCTDPTVRSAFSALTDIIEYIEPDTTYNGLDARIYSDDSDTTFKVSANNYSSSSSSSSSTLYPYFSSFLTSKLRSPTDESWGLDRIDQRTLPLDGMYRPPNSNEGENVNIFVLDSGARITHKDFRNRIVPGKNFSPDQNDDDVNDCNGHGTHVLSLTGGNKYGAAKKATLVPVRVYDCSNSGPMSQALEGISWTLKQIKNSEKKSVVNMSFGGKASSILNAAVSQLHKAGAVIVVAAGNENQNACGLSPGSAREAITIGASNPDDTFGAYSNYGPCVNMISPGTSIPGAYASSDTAERFMTGTSMAAPLVTGMVATFLSQYRDATPSQTRKVFECGSTQNIIKEVPGSTPNRFAYSPVNGYDSKCASLVQANTGDRVRMGMVPFTIFAVSLSIVTLYTVTKE